MDERGRRTARGRRRLGGVASCSRSGPGAAAAWGRRPIRYTRMRYNEVVRDTNDQQLLMNIVRLRYADSPVFIDLPNITSQFELAAGGSDPGPAGSQTNFGIGGAVGARHADPELPPARGAGDRQGAADPAVGRPVQRGQRRRQHRAAPAADDQRHQRRAQRRPRHDPHAAGSPTTTRSSSGASGSSPSLRDREATELAIGTDEESDVDVRPDPRGLGRRARPARRGQGRLRLPLAGSTAG